MDIIKEEMLALKEDLGDIYDDVEIYIDDICTSTKNFIFSNNTETNT